MKKTNKIVGYLFAQGKNISMEHRLFLSLIFVGLVISMIGLFMTIILSLPLITVFFCLILSCFLLVIYYFARFRGIFKPFILPIILFTYIFVFSIWLFAGGMKGPNILSATLVLIFALLIVPVKNRPYIFYLYIACVILVYLLQFFKPEIIIDYPTETSRWIDSFITTLCCSFCIYLIINFIHKNYTIERLRAEKNETYNVITNQLKDWVSLTDMDGNFVSANPALSGMTGYSETELLKMSVSNIESKSQSQLQGLVPENKANKIGIPYLIRIRCKDETEFVAEIVTNRITISGQDFLLSTGKDITKRKQEELERQVIYEISQSVTITYDLNELLKFIHHSLRKVLFADNCFVALHDKNTGLFSFPYYADQFDTTPEPIEMPKSCTAYVFRTGNPLLITPALLHQLIEQNEVELVGSPSPSWIGVPLKTPNGTIGVWVLQNYEKENVYSEYDIQFLDSVGSQIAMAIERRQAEIEIKQQNEDLLKLNATKDKFFSIIAHDLRTPFNGFLGLTKLMVEDLPDLSTEKIHEFAVSLQRSATNLYRLLTNLLQWAQIQQGAIPFNPEVIQLDLVVAESIAMIQESAKNKDIELHNDISAGLVAFADRNMLQTVIRNLVSNSVKFTGKGGKVYISARINSDNRAELSIKDLGIGMSPEMVNNLFRIDVKTSRRGTEGEPSTGLGLLLCKEFVEKQGGSICVESKAGIGSTFYFTLPNDPVPTEKLVVENDKTFDSQDNKISPEFQGLKILLAEDDETSEMLISIAVKMFTKEIIIAGTGVEAVDACRSHPDIDLVLMDLKMPEMSGYEAIRQIRQFNGEVIIIAQTAFGLSGDRDRAIEAGCNDYLTKPVRKDELVGLIQKYFRK